MSKGPKKIHFVSQVVDTTFRVRDGLVVFQEDEFSIPGWQILLGALAPWLPVPAPAPPVEELRRAAEDTNSS